MPTAEAAQICISNLCLNELAVDAVTAGATVCALAVSIALGFISWKFTRDDRNESRAAEQERRTRVFGYGELESKGLRVHVTNGTEFPVRDILARVFSYGHTPNSMLLHEGTEVPFPFLGPGEKGSRWVDFADYPHLADMTRNIGMRIIFCDMDGQFWARLPNGRVIRFEEWGKHQGPHLPDDLYSFSKRISAKRRGKRMLDMWARIRAEKTGQKPR